MFRYPARLIPDGTGFAVKFRDIPEAITCGASREEAIDMAADALVTAMDFYFEDKRPVPSPSGPKRGDVLIELPRAWPQKCCDSTQCWRRRSHQQNWLAA